MKKLLFVLLVLLAFGLLTAVESDPSATVGYVKYPSVAGLNFAAMPMDDGMTLVSQVGAYMGPLDEIDTIFLWNSTGQYWDGCVNYGGAYYEPDYTVGPGTVLYYSSSYAFDYYSIGDMPVANAQYSIVPGLNTIMLPLNKSALSLVSLVGADIGPLDEIDTIFLWNSAGQYWDGCVNYGGAYYEPDYATPIGTPMYISSSASITWPAGPRGATRSVAPTRK